MPSPHFPAQQEPCPYLPLPPQVMTPDTLLSLGVRRDDSFYQTALQRAQWLWMEGKPAKAILLLNRAFAATPSSPPLSSVHQWPYRALAWILSHTIPETLPGNPRVHYQHLATRMSGPQPELRAWRAWACWWLVRQIWPDMPGDEKQQGIREPTAAEVEAGLVQWGSSAEACLWKEIFRELRSSPQT